MQSHCWRLWLGMVVLCVLAGSGLLLDDLAPSGLPSLPAAGLRYAVASAVFFAITAGWKRHTHHAGAATAVQLAGWGAVLLALLPGFFDAAGTRVSGGTELVLFAGIPACIVFLRSQGEEKFGAMESSQRLLLPALTGFGGAALLISWSLPSRAAGGLWLIAMAVAAGVTGFAVLRLHPLLARVPLLTAAAYVCAGAAAADLVGGFASRTWLRSSWSATLDRTAVLTETLRFLDELIVPLLSLWLLRGLGAVAYSARYLLVLLVALTESFLVARARLSWTVAGGVCLMMWAAFTLLREGRGTMKDSILESHSV